MKGYLCHPWTFNPEKSWDNAVRWTHQLYQRGWTVFSPILHTHKFWEEMKKIDPGYKHDFLRWDINLLEAMKKDGNFYIIMSETALRQDDRWKLMDHQDMNLYVDQTPLWFSSGCRIECRWGIENKIPIVHLESILQTPIEANPIMRFLHTPR